MESINITPTWTGLLPALVQLADHKDQKVRSDSWAELRKMARAADRWNACADPLVNALEFVLKDLNTELDYEARLMIEAAIRNTWEVQP